VPTANIIAPTSYTNQIHLITLSAYDTAGRKTNEVQVGAWTNRFTFSPAGDLLSLTDGKNQTTSWVYDNDGRVKEKWYQGQSTADLVYSYNANGLLINRLTRTGTGASTNGFNTVFRYNPVGSLTNVDYPAGTDLQFEYDALQRRTKMVDAIGTTTYTYTVGSGMSLIAEDGPWASDTLTVTNRLGRRLGLHLQQPSGPTWSQVHTYDTGGRLATVASPAGTFTHSYTATASGNAGTLLQRVLLPTTGGTAYLTNRYDKLGRTLSTQLRNSAHAINNQYEYAYTTNHQRTLVTRTNSFVTAWNSSVNLTYDAASQVLGAWTTNSVGAVVSAECRGYLYDAAGNLATRTNNATGGTTTASVNALNQLTSGLDHPSFSHDRRGNLTFAGNGTPGTSLMFAYNYEDQCTSAGYYNYGTKSVYTYDGLGRLKRRLDYTWSGGSWYQGAEIRYYWDGWLLVQERNGTTPVVSYTRGHDLSGSREGAGGIGGLLGRSTYASGAWGSHAFYHADANGNVTMLLRADQTHGASYKYDPFGRTISSSGPLATANTMRFSSKEWHEAAGIYYYGYRFYKPEWQRWLIRDQVGERGADGPNLYSFVRNLPMNRVDPLGHVSWGWPVVSPPGFPSSLPPFGCRKDPECSDIMDTAERLEEQYNRDRGWGGFRHCYAACALRKCFGAIGGLLRDIWDWRNEDPSVPESAADMRAEDVGEDIGRQGTSCEDGCAAAFPTGSEGYPVRRG
jgi:RHS repeat-associated protein